MLAHGDLHGGHVYAFPGPVLAGVPGFSDVRLTGAHYDLAVGHLRALGADRLLGTLPGGYAMTIDAAATTALPRSA